MKVRIDMMIQIAVSMDYQLSGAEAVLLTLEAAQTDGQTVLESAMQVDDATTTRIKGEFGVGERIWATVAGQRLTLTYSTKVDVTRPDTAIDHLPAPAICALPPDVLSCLRPSRFCPSDLFTDFVGQQFGHLDGGAKVAAIVAWVHAQTRYVVGSSDAGTTAIDTFASRQGVCRDFSHLTCSLIRAAGIPARYASVYGADVQPPDFHAASQVWLGGAWHLLDATGMCSPSGLVIIGVGRDAADVSFLETSHWAQMTNQSVCVARV